MEENLISASDFCGFSYARGVKPLLCVKNTMMWK